MKLLFTIDKKNYTENMPIVERYAVRALIRKNNKYAMQKSSIGEYKIPGGGVEPEVSSETVKTEMAESELSKGYHLEWAELEHVISENMKRQEENWIIRDTEFLKRYNKGEWK